MTGSSDRNETGETCNGQPACLRVVQNSGSGSFDPNLGLATIHRPKNYKRLSSFPLTYHVLRLSRHLECQQQLSASHISFNLTLTTTTFGVKDFVEDPSVVLLNGKSGHCDFVKILANFCVQYLAVLHRFGAKHGQERDAENHRVFRTAPIVNLDRRKDTSCPFYRIRCNKMAPLKITTHKLCFGMLIDFCRTYI